MRTTLSIALALLIISATLSGFIYSTQHARADAIVDPDDPTAVWDCYPDADADGNPIQTCGFGHYEQECSFVAGVESCEQDFAPNPPSGTTLFEPISQSLASGTSFSLSGAWNGIPFSETATTSLALEQSGSVTWKYTPTTIQTRFHGPQSFNDVLSTATLTLDLYKGVMGSSTLVYSQTVSSSTPSTLPVTFSSSGPYFMTFSATYPPGTYPPGESPADICTTTSGDFCSVPIYSLADFQNVMTQGDALESSGSDLGNYIPAAYGILPFTVAAAQPVSSIASNVLFLPGSMESRLYTRTPLGEHRLWEPMTNLDVSSLVMNPDGTSKNLIYTRDVMDYLYSDNSAIASLVRSRAGSDSIMYAPFESFMDGLVHDGTIKHWQAYPYDWRYEVDDIVKNGTLVASATSSPTRVYLQDVVQELASSSPTGKVTIVAHSNGGLLAKALAVELQKEGKIGLLDRLILVGTPQLGTPNAIGDLLHGDGQTQGDGFVMYRGNVRSVGITMPGPYDLLPSAAYFKIAPTPVVTFADDTIDAPYRAQYGASIISYSQLLKFVANVGTTRSTPSIDDWRTPAILSAVYMQKASATHTAIDSWIPPASLAVTSIIGWGQPTVESYEYSSQLVGWSCRLSGFLQLRCGGTPNLEHSLVEDKAGDNTVVASSAEALGQTFYLDTHALEINSGITIGHQSLLSATSTQNQIKDLLQGTPAIEPFITTNQPPDTHDPLLIVSVHSPVTILATDDDGNQTGAVSIPGFPDMYFIKESIPGSSLQTVGDEKYISLPPNKNYSFSLHGYDSGETSVEVKSLDENGNFTNLQTFANIPTTASTTATFTVTKNTASAPDVDIDGDGKVDLIASSSINNTSTSTSLALLNEQFSTLRRKYGLGILLFIALEKLRLNKNSPDIEEAIACVEKLLNSKDGDEMSSDGASLLQQSIATLHL